MEAVVIILLLMATGNALWFNRAYQNRRSQQVRLNSALKLRIRMDNEK